MALDPQPEQALAEPSTSFLPNSFIHPASDDSDSDAVNTSNAKVYFGRFQTPEKKIASLVNAAQEYDPIPEPTRLRQLRRSSRLSTPPIALAESVDIVPEPSEKEAESDTDPQASHVIGGWIEASLPDFLREDEPSSAIASRIIRAHDNPSPPPRAIRDSLSPRHRAPLSASPVRSPSISDASENHDTELPAARSPLEATPPPINESASPTVTMAQTISASPTFTQPILVTNADEVQEVEKNLIEFDRTVVMSSPSQAVLVSPTPRHAPSGFTTVDDLLFSSPCQIPLPPSNDISVDLPAVSPSGMSERRNGMLDNGQVSASPNVQVNVLDADDNSLPTPTAQGSPSLNTINSPMISLAPTPVPVLSALKSPPRRSARLSSVVSPSSVETLEAGPSTPTLTTSRGQKRRRSRSSRVSLSPKKVDWYGEPELSDDNSKDAESSPNFRKTKRSRKILEIGKDAPEAAHSLSPRSADILRNITVADLSQAAGEEKQGECHTEKHNPRPTESEQGINTEVIGEEIHTPERPQADASSDKVPTLSSVQRPPPGVFAHQTRTPVRGGSQPPMAQPVFSPAKLQLSQSTLEDPNRSPARRVQAKSERSTSNEHTNSRVNVPGARMPVFSRPPVSLNDPDRSPAKRVAMPFSKAQTSFKEPITTPKASQRSAPTSSVGQSTAGPAPKSLTASPSKPTSIQLAPPAKPPSKPLQKSSDMKSSLPTSRLAKPSSRIPRSGATKSGAASAKAASKLPMPSSSKTDSKLKAPKPIPRPQPRTSKPGFSRLTQLPSSSSSGSDDSSVGRDTIRSIQTSRIGSKALATNRRIRENETTPAQPMIQARRVTPGMFGGPVKSSIAESKRRQPPAEVPSSPVKAMTQMRPIQGREVVKGTLQDFELTNPAIINLEAIREARERDKAEQERLRQEQLQREKEQEEREREEAKAASEAVQSSSTNSTEPEPYVPLLQGPSLQTFTFECPPQRSSHDQMDVDTLLPSTSHELAPNSEQGGFQIILPDLSGLRKSSRPRRQASTPDDLGDDRPILSTAAARRRATGPPRARGAASNPTLIFSISGTALTSLTNSNTARNQHYLAEPEVRVIRKEGDRPESPAMKLRTVVEKQKEEADKMRTERAARRRGEDSLNTSELDHDKAFLEDSLKHRRGPGEDEDYETPLRPANGRKCVTWDRGLEAVVFLDEIEMDGQKKPNAETPKKGCLVVKAPLDGFGNVLNAQTPFFLSPEKVVVTKFVYDNDEEALELDMPLPPPPPRTRGRKSR